MTLPHMPTEADVRELPDVGYETRDVDIRVVLWLGVSIAVTIVIAGGVVWLLLGYYRAEAKRNDPVTSPLADATQRPPAPRLQESPNREYREFRATKEAALNSYGWVDREKGVVRIPISRAMELLAERGLPAPQEEKTKSEEGEK